MSRDRIIQIRVSGLRVIRHLELDLKGVTVLIGDNGTGKSSILEALELLREAPKPIAYVSDVIVNGHGGLEALLRRGEKELRLGVSIAGAGPRIDYSFSIGVAGGVTARILTETVDVHGDPGAPEPLHALDRKMDRIQVFDINQRQLVDAFGSDSSVDSAAPVGPDQLALPAIGVRQQPALRRVREVLDGIELHVPFATRPPWQERELGIAVGGPRWPTLVQKTQRLERYASNLSGAYQELKNSDEEAWQRVVERARLGLGDRFRNLVLQASGRGKVELSVLFGDARDRPLPVEALSEGQISYLGFIAIAELHGRRSVLGFDEPEVHLHPALIARVVWMLEESSSVANMAPVILATHSDRLLDALGDPSASAVLCELDEENELCIRRPDPTKLSKWLERYTGLGTICAEGHAGNIFVSKPHS